MNEEQFNEFMREMREENERLITKIEEVQK